MPARRCDAVGDIFIGRSKTVYDVFRSVLARRCTTITGMHGIGKTQVALKVAQFGAERHKFANTFFVCLRNPETGPVGLLRSFAAALGVPDGPTHLFFEKVHAKYSGNDNEKYLVRNSSHHKLLLLLLDCWL